MDVRPMQIEGAFEMVPRRFEDERGVFLEWFRADRLGSLLGHTFSLAQANLSVSRRGTLRGIHFADVPPGQAKYVTCIRGAVLDAVVDIRVGSPTFGHWCTLTLDDRDRRAIYLAEGLGHAFMALSDDAAVTYLCSEPYAPEREHGLHPLDPEIGVAWPADVEALLSPKDQAAPTLSEAREQGLLPDYGKCVAFYAELRSISGSA